MIGDTWQKYISLTEVQETNNYLKEEIKKLKHEALKYREEKKAFERLNKMLEYKSSSKREMTFALIIGKGPLSWSKMLTIDKGSNDGIKKNATVVTYEGLVGHIIQSAPNYSKVLLITDVRSAVDALEQNNRTRGVVVGKGSDICEMKYISRDADIQVGHPVISSGFGGVFPKGILIGKVSKVDKAMKGLFKNVTIIPAVKVDILEEVFVINE